MDPARGLVITPRAIVDGDTLVVLDVSNGTFVGEADGDSVVLCLQGYQAGVSLATVDDERC